MSIRIAQKTNGWGLDRKVWYGKILRVSPKADFRPFTGLFLFKHTAHQYEPTAEMINWALGQLSQRQQQILIRLFGLDGKEPRTFEEIAEETEHTVSWVRKIRSESINTLQEDDRFRYVLEGRSKI